MGAGQTQALWIRTPHMTALSHFLEEGEISDPDENLIRVPAEAAPSTAVSRTHPQHWSLARCEAEQTIPGSEALGWRWQDLHHLQLY